MSQASIQLLSTSLTGEEPFIGDLFEGEAVVNVADGRVWAGDPLGNPVELGGAVKNKPIGSLIKSNYLSLDVTDPNNLPIANTNPMDVPEGFYRENKILLKFSQTPPEGFYTYFDYEVKWGEKSFWYPDFSEFTWGGNSDLINQDADNPIDLYKTQGRQILIELSTFGPNTYWMGRVLWINTIN